jgi:sugar lactone lactonase YvrE
MFSRRRARQPASSRPRRTSFFSPASFFRSSSHERRRLLAIEPFEVRLLLSSVPVVTTEAAKLVSATGATLNGTVNPDGSTATAYFQYSTDSTFTPTIETTIGSGYDEPFGAAVDAAGDVFVADNNNNAVKEILPDGTTKTLGSGFANPNGVAVDSAGDVFVADNGNDAVKEILPNGTVKTIGSGFFLPQGVAVDAAGDVFVADRSSDAIKEVLPNGAVQAIGSGFSAPYGVAVDAFGDVFVADTFNNAVKEVLPGGAIQTIGSGFNEPTSVTLDAAGDVFVADYGDNAIREILPSGVINSIGSGFSGPHSVALDAAGDVFVADTFNNRVVELSPVSVPAAPSALSGSSATAVSAMLTGLTPGTTYYYRAVASSAGGTVADSTNPPESFTTPTITWTTPADMTYGTPLGATQLDASASIAGSFTYTLADGTTPAAGAVLHAGQNQVLNVTFTPTDSTDYATDTAEVEINVDPTPLTITADDKSTVYGATLPALTAAYSGFVNGDNAASLTRPPTLATTATAASHVSGSPYAITASGAADPDYTINYVTGALAVTAAPTSTTVSASASSAIYGQAVNLTANVSASPSSPSEGNVAFFDNGALFATKLVTSGVAALDNVQLAAGSHFITASYRDTSGNFASSSTAAGPNSTIETVAGGGLGDGLPAVAEAVAEPFGTAVDSLGDLFIADPSQGVVREVNHATGVITTVAGGGTAGLGDGGPATSAELGDPYAVAVDSSGHLFIADQASNRIREVDLTTGMIITVAGNGTQGFSGDGGAATAAELARPEGVAVDSSRDLFISDWDNARIREVNLATGIITTVAGSGREGFSGDGGSATAAELYEPHGVAADSSGHLFIADTRNERIREVDLATGVITTVAGNGTQSFSGDGGAATAAELSDPEGVAVDSSGHFFIADYLNNRIREVDPAGVITTLVGNGTAGFSGDGGPATAAELNNPLGVAADLSGSVFIADYLDNRIREVDHATGIITTVAGNGTTDFGGDGGAATAAELTDAGAVAVDSSGNLFIADYRNNRIREVNHATGIITTVARNGTAGFSGDGGAAAAAELDGPEGVAVDSSGHLFIADTQNLRIREEDLATRVITTIAGNGTYGGSGDGGPATAAELANPVGVAVDSSGDLFVADTWNNRVREVDRATGVISTVAGNGTRGSSGDGGAAAAAEFYLPSGIVIDSSGDLFIADEGNERVRKVDGATGVITTVAGGGTAGLGDGGPATVAELAGPFGLAIDSSANLFIADMYHYRVREVDRATGFITTLAGTGAAGSSGDGGAAIAAELAAPFGVAVNSLGDLFIGTGNVREVMDGAEIDVTPTALTITADDTSKVYGAALPTLTAIYSGFVNGDTAATLITLPTLSTTAAISSAVSGSPYAITLGGASDPNYIISYVPGKLTVTPAALTITADDQTTVYGGALPALTVTYTGLVNGDMPTTFGASPNVAATVAAPATNRAGSYTGAIVASGAVDADYTITYVPGKLTVTAATLTITADDKSKLYGAALPTLTASYSGFVNGDSVANLTTPLTLSTTATAASHVSGSPYVITAGGAVDADYTISYAAGALAVTPAPLTIAADDQSQFYGAALPTLTASYSGFVNGDTAASLATAPTLATAATASSHVSGSPYTITASGAIDADYTISYVAGELTIPPAPLTITADDKTKVYGAPLPAPTASYSGFVNDDSAASLTTPPTLTTTATASSHVSGSPYAITPSGAVDGDYSISYVAGALTITPAPLTITADDKAKVYGAPLPALTASYTGFVNGDSSAGLATQPALSTTATAGSHVSGNPYAITADGAIDADYTISYVPGSLTVTPAPLTITADDQSKIYGAALPTLTASYSGFVNGDSSGGLTAKPAVSTTATAGSHVSGNPYAITANGAVDADYTISYVSGALIVTPAPLTITADDQSKIYGAALPALTASYSGFVNSDTAISLATPPTLSTTATVGSHVSGSPYTIAASGAADSDYTISYVPGALTVTPAALAITAGDRSKIYGAAMPTLAASFSGFVNGDIATSLTTQPTLATTATAASHVPGSPYAITASGAADSDYTISYVPGALTVTPATLTVKANDASRSFGAANPTFTDTITGFVNGDDASVVSGEASLSTTATATSGVGEYPITPSAGTLSAADYSFGFQSGTLAVTTNLQGDFGLVEDIYTIGSGTVSVSAANGVLANDSGPGRLTVTAGRLTGAEGGTFAFNADGSFTYTPPTDFPGFDDVQYTATDAAGDQASATVNVLSQTGGVVWKFYESVLGRDPDAGGLKFWINDFVHGGKTGDIAVGFFESPELLNKVIGGYYEQYLLRSADAAGLAHWESVWGEDGGPEKIRAFFAESDEFYTSAGGTPDAWINALYQRILARSPDPQGEQFWLKSYQQQVAAGGDAAAVRFNIALAFLTSQEDFGDDVTGWFNEYLLRAPTDAERQQYTNEMLAGASDRQIEQEITNLPEYGQNPPAAPDGAATRLADYYQQTSPSGQQQASIAAKDALFARLGG